jgi:hypothetical protein
MRSDVWFEIGSFGLFGWVANSRNGRRAIGGRAGFASRARQTLGTRTPNFGLEFVSCVVCDCLGALGKCCVVLRLRLETEKRFVNPGARLGG